VPASAHRPRTSADPGARRAAGGPDRSRRARSARATDRADYGRGGTIKSIGTRSINFLTLHPFPSYTCSLSNEGAKEHPTH
jgi:hypothetical protein